jgi:hypothetical protein
VEMETILGSARHQTKGMESHNAPILYASKSRGVQSWKADGLITIMAGGLALLKSSGPAKLKGQPISMTASLVRLKGTVICDKITASALIVSPKYSTGVNNMI